MTALETLPVASLPEPAADFDSAVLAEERAWAAFNEVLTAKSEAEGQFFAIRPEMPIGMQFLINDTTETYNARWAARKLTFEQATIEARERFNLDWHDREEERSSDEYDKALQCLLQMPAPDLAAVIKKIEVATKQGLELDDIAPALEDLRRLGRRDHV